MAGFDIQNWLENIFGTGQDPAGFHSFLNPAGFHIDNDSRSQ